MITESASQFSYLLGNDSLQKIAIFNHEKSLFLFRAYLLDFLLDVLKLHMKIVLLLKPNPMMESTCVKTIKKWQIEEDGDNCTIGQGTLLTWP